jgi:hypothetical protein
MRVCFVLPSLRRSGGAGVATAHARGLARDHGVEAELVVVEGTGDGRAPEGVPVRLLADAPGERYDVAISTWWETAAALWELDAGRRAMLLQSFEQRFYGVEAPFERLAAELTLALPLDFIVVAPWIRDILAELRPGAHASVVRPGIDKPTFEADRTVRREGPLRVLIEGQPTLPIKGVEEAVAAVRATSEPVHSTLVALDPDSAGDAPVDRVVGALDPEGMAALYRDSDVLLKLSRVEGLGLSPVEGFHSGLPCVVTPYTGHDEYVRHGENGVVVGFDDPSGTAGWLDLLARDRDRLAALSAGARRTADTWPGTPDATRVMHDVLGELVDAAPADGDSALTLRTMTLHADLGRGRLKRLEETEAALTAAQAHVQELSDSRDECSDMLDEARAELARIRGTPAYRMASAAKRAGRALRKR